MMQSKLVYSFPASTLVLMLECLRLIHMYFSTFFQISLTVSEWVEALDSESECLDLVSQLASYRGLKK